MDGFNRQGGDEEGKAKKRLSLHLTGEPDADGIEMNFAVDALDTKSTITHDLALDSLLQSVDVFLSTLQREVENWQSQVGGLAALPADEAGRRAKSILSELKLFLPKYDEPWKALEPKASSEERKTLEILKWDIKVLYDRLLELQ